VTLPFSVSMRRKSGSGIVGTTGCFSGSVLRRHWRMATPLTPSLPISPRRRGWLAGQSTSTKLDSILTSPSHPSECKPSRRHWSKYAHLYSGHARGRQWSDKRHKRPASSVSVPGTCGQGYGRCSTGRQDVGAGAPRSTPIKKCASHRNRYHVVCFYRR